MLPTNMSGTRAAGTPLSAALKIIKAFEKRAREKTTPMTNKHLKAKEVCRKKALNLSGSLTYCFSVSTFSTPNRMSARQQSPGIKASQKTVR